MHILAPSRWIRNILLTVVGVVFAIPLASMLLFTLQDDGHGLSSRRWIALFDPAQASLYGPIWEGLLNSTVIALITVVIILLLLLPTLVLVNVRYPALWRIVEFVCVLPISIPAIVLVVGFAPLYLWIGQLVGPDSWTLSFAYAILALPFAFRSIQASIDAANIGTLSEAARTLGARWPRIMISVIVPNIRAGLLTSALVTVAVVYGEFTVASLLNRQNFQTGIYLVSQQDAYASVALSLLSLFGVWLLLFLLDRASQRRYRRRAGQQ